MLHKAAELHRSPPTTESGKTPPPKRMTTATSTSASCRAAPYPDPAPPAHPTDHQNLANKKENLLLFIHMYGGEHTAALFGGGSEKRENPGVVYSATFSLHDILPMSTSVTTHPPPNATCASFNRRWQPAKNTGSVCCAPRQAAPNRYCMTVEHHKLVQMFSYFLPLDDEGYCAVACAPGCPQQ